MEPTMNGLAQTEETKSSPETFRCPGDGRHDDMDLVLLHVDFPKLLELAARVKQARKVLIDSPDCPATVRGTFKKSEIKQVIGRIHDQLLQRPPNPRNAIHRGHFPIIDSTIDDAVATLQREWDHLSAYIEQAQATKSKQAKQDKSSKKRGRAKKEAIAIKYSKWQTDILMAWMIDHIEDPFPDQKAISELMQKTNLTQSQVINWTTNVRKRNRKATCEGGKKPHHFIDFLFLVQDRKTVAKEKTPDDSGIMRSASFPPGPNKSKGRRKHRSISKASSFPSTSISPHQTLETSPEHHAATTIPPSPVVKRTSRPGRPSGRRSVKTERITTEDEDPCPIEPLSLVDAIIDEGVMMEFAQIWLTPGREPGILPTVTEDSLDLPLTTLSRSPSFDLVDFEDIHSWAAEMDLVIEI